MELTVTEYFRWIFGLPPKNIVTRLAPGEPPLPGLDRYGRNLPPSWLVPLQRKIRGLIYRFDKWSLHGTSIDTRTPTFAILIIMAVIIGMFLPEFFGLSH